jgi:hypothetical protein
VSVSEHVHDLPTDDELAQLIGAATPHFALQIRERVASFAAALGPTDARQDGLQAAMARLDALATGGEAGGEDDPDLPARSSLAVGVDRP